MYNEMMDTIGLVNTVDPELAAAMDRELNRQRQNIELIASENIVSPAVMAAMGSILTNKYAEGLPGKRYYGGCVYVDEVENIAIERACKLFGAKYANVQPHSGAQANLAVYFALLDLGDTVMGMDLSQGGHLTHGSPVNMSGKNYNFVSYGVNADGVIDYAELEKQVKKVRPKLIVAGASAYPRAIDFEKIAEIVKGVAEGCKQSDAALIGGETAEHPGLMPEDDYDLAGFAVGVCDKKEMITGENLAAGDVLIGMASTGVHSNGFSLVRKVFDITKESLDTYYDDLGTTLGEALLAPTRIYVKALKSIKNAGVTVKACSHITGGGFYENIPRMLKEGTHAVVEKDSYPIPPIFAKLAKEGEIEEQMMYNTFNMGLGMVLAVDPADVDKTMDAIREAGDQPYVVGKIEAGEKGVTLC